MKHKNKNRLTRLIRMELVCLGVVSIVVFALVRWSGSRAEGNEGNETGGRPLAVTGAPLQGGDEADGEGQINVNPQPNPTQEADGAVSATPVPSVTDVPAGTDAKTDTTDPTPTPVPAEKEPTPTTAAATPKPTKVPDKTPTPEPTPTKEVTPEPTKQPENQDGITAKPGMDMDFINSLSKPQSGETLEAAGAVKTVYYLQTDSRWGNKFYGGEDTIAKYGCGPTSMAIVVSSLTEIGIDPEQMSGWANSKGYWYPQSGSLHSIVNGTAKAFGLESEGIGNDSATPEKITKALKNGDMVVALMGKGHFTKGGHFIVLRGITQDGKILVADCNSRENTLAEWDLETLTGEAKWASDGGPFWIIRNPNTIK